MEYANKINAPAVILYGEDEIKSDKPTLRDLSSGNEKSIEIKELVNEIRTLEVSQLVSKVSAISSVRKKLVLEQQEMGKYKGIVMDGRDIGTVVFPDAEIKLFMTASADTRAQRRYKELIAKGDTVSYEEILQNVVERDHLDYTRKDSPLIKAKDAIEIDNSDLGLNEQFDKIYALVKSVSSIN